MTLFSKGGTEEDIKVLRTGKRVRESAEPGEKLDHIPPAFMGLCTDLRQISKYIIKKQLEPEPAGLYVFFGFE